MALRHFRQILRLLHQSAEARALVGPADAELLARYVLQRDEAAFELLLWRHGGMVLNLCRRILHDEHDAEDAFQATFLAFIRKAPSIVRREAVAGWLHRVAYRVALDVKAKARKPASQNQGGETVAAQVPSNADGSELRPLLDEEMNRLPERYRLPLVLCYLEGKTNEEAARQLGCPPGTIFSRLARGREMLRRRLVRRGLGLSAGGFALALSQTTAPAALDVSLVRKAFQSSLAFAAGKTAASAASSRIIALAEGVLQAMFLAKLKTLAALALILVAMLGGGILTHQVLTAAQEPNGDKDKLAKLDVSPKDAGIAKQEPVAVRVVEPQPGGVERITQARGTVRALDQQDIFAPVSGILATLKVDLGSHVKKDDIIAVIDAPLLVLERKQADVAVKQAKGSILEAEARMKAAQAEVEVAKSLVREKQAVLESARADLTFRQSQLERFERLAKAVSVSQETVDEQGRLREAARGKVSAAEAAIANAQADVEVKRSKVAQAEAARITAQASLETAEIALEKADYPLRQAQIRAPLDGVVTQCNCRRGHTVRAGEEGGRQPLLTVTRTDVVKVVVDVMEDGVPDIEPGLPVDFRLEGARELIGTGYTVSRIAYAREHRDGPTSRFNVIRVEIDVPNPKQTIRPGMSRVALIHLKKRYSDTGLHFPASAVIEDQTNWWVYVVREGKAVRTQVKVTGWSLDLKEAQVDSGLKPTDNIVIEPKGLKGDMIPVKVHNEGQK